MLRAAPRWITFAAAALRKFPGERKSAGRDDPIRDRAEADRCAERVLLQPVQEVVIRGSGGGANDGAYRRRRRRWRDKRCWRARRGSGWRGRRDRRGAGVIRRADVLPLILRSAVFPKRAARINEDLRCGIARGNRSASVGAGNGEIRSGSHRRSCWRIDRADWRVWRWSGARRRVGERSSLSENQVAASAGIYDRTCVVALADRRANHARHRADRAVADDRARNESHAPADEVGHQRFSMATSATAPRPSKSSVEEFITPKGVDTAEAVSAGLVSRGLYGMIGSGFVALIIPAAPVVPAVIACAIPLQSIPSLLSWPSVRPPRVRTRSPLLKSFSAARAAGTP